MGGENIHRFVRDCEWDIKNQWTSAGMVYTPTRDQNRARDS